MSPLAGQAVVKNLYQGRYGVAANEGADRFARGEEWLQTNTLDGQKAHDSFMRIGEPGYFQEFGPAGYHVSIGFANPKIINERGKGMCATASDCPGTITGHITTARMSRTPDERLYGSGDHASYSFTQCYISLGDPDGADFQFSKCADDGSFTFTNVPPGNWKISTFDQWNDQVVDGITTPVAICAVQPPSPAGDCQHVDMKEMAVHQWQADIYTRTFLDVNGDGISNVDGDGNPTEPGLVFAATNIRFRDGSYSNFNSTDLNGFAGFNEVFPLFNWYVIETDSTNYKNTGTHVVYDSGGPVDGSSPSNVPCNSSSTKTKPCGDSSIAASLANTYEPNPLPPDLSIPGAVYCTDADCTGMSIDTAYQTSSWTQSGPSTSTGRIDPPWVLSEGWQGYSGQNNFLEFGKKPYAEGENGGIHGHVIYASTRPFDDPQLLLQLSWEPMVPHVRINLYKEDVATDKVTPTLTMIDHTETSSWDDWAQGFHLGADGHTWIPNMSCPGQGTDLTTFSDPYFWFALKDQPQFLDLYNKQHPAASPFVQDPGVLASLNPGGVTPMPYDSQFKCYDGMHNWNQLQPAPYDGMYSFPSVTGLDPVSGKPSGTNCTACIANPTVALGDPSSDPKVDPYRAGMPMLPDGKYVVEIVLPEGYELVKEEDKNILIGDNFIAPVVQQFGGLGSIFIMPDQAEIAEAYNANNGQNSTMNQGRDSSIPSHEGDTGSVETFWPCVGEVRTVPDYISLYPGSYEVAPFAGANRPLCDRKEVTLTDQTSVLTKFYVFTQTHAAAHFTGIITDDFTAEFDPYSPQFGEKFAPSFLPVSVKDWTGNEVNRVYSDAWGEYNGLNYSSWEVNPPNPTGYGPTMMVDCMNDPGPVLDTNSSSPTFGQMITDPLFQPGYSDFCYELPYMPAQTGYFDTPVVPTSAFAGGYNTPDCNYPEFTPAVSNVTGDVQGPWIAALKGVVLSVNLSVNGSGYTSTPNVAFTAAPAGGTTATGTAVLTGGTINNVSVSNGGRGYSSAPTVSLNGGGGSGATTSVTMTNSVNTVVVNTGGSGYTSTPSVSFNLPAGGLRAQGTAVRTGNTITAINVTNPGSGYTGTAVITISGGGGSGVSVTVNMAKSVLAVTVLNSGSGYTGNPTVAFSGGGGTGAAATAHGQFSVGSVTIANAGIGYTTAPSVTFSGGTPTTPAQATSTIEQTAAVTITALGDTLVDSYAYSGPSSTLAPYNQQKTKRHYGFGPVPTDFSKFPALVSPKNYNCNSSDANSVCPYVSVGGVSLGAVSWSDGSITGSITALPAAAQNTCKIAQQAIYGGSAASCGQLVITAANLQQSIDAVTVTIGGKHPTMVPAGQTIQSAIDAAAPGDMIIVSPGTHGEMVLMWKPVRLQGVGAASSIIDASPHPAGKLDPWRRQVVCLFGLALNGQPSSDSNPFDPSATFTCPGTMNYFSGGPDYPTMVVDRVPMEGILGWDTTVNGNLAEQLIEPSLLGAYEGAGITVLGKGVKIPGGSADVWGSGSEAAFPTGTILLTSSDCLAGGQNPYPSNYLCNPSSIDGLTIKNSSQGGGGILIHAWGHDLQVANNRVFNNQGTMSGGITVGQGEHTDVPVEGGGVSNVPPGSCIGDTGTPANMALPFCYDLDVNLHNNFVIQNSSLGDELFSSTPAGAGGVTICNGSDYYKFDYNWVCGNMSTGDGAGVAHVGFSYDGDIEHNSILYNQTTNPTISTNGGGLLIMGAPDPDPPCAENNDKDCVPDPATILPSDGVGPGLIVNANLILGNSADAGSGGGLRLQGANGTDVLNFPNGSAATNWRSVAGHPAHPAFQLKTPWNAVSITNNIISNNVAGWDGGGISLQDALAVDFVNNTIVSNNSTASAGVLFQTLFAPLASTDQTNFNTGANNNCTMNGSKQSCPQPAGLVSVTNSAVLQANVGILAGGGKLAVTCPINHGTPRSGTTPAQCTAYSVPELYNDLFWQNKAMYIGVGNLDNGLQNQQNVVGVYDAAFGSTTPRPPDPQLTTGSCVDQYATNSYWDIGVRGDSAPGNHGGGTLTPFFSVLTNQGTYAEAVSNTTTGNLLGSAANGTVKSIYCNGSRIPVEAEIAKGAYGWQVPPGTNESNALPAPPFTLIAGATTDEGNNWINLRWGPLAQTLVLTPGGSSVYNLDAHLQDNSAAIDKITTGTAFLLAPTTDFYGTTRGTAIDIGAVEAPNPPVPVLTSISPNSGFRGQTQSVTLTGSFLDRNNNAIGTANVLVSGTGVTVSNVVVVNSTTITATFAISNTATTGAHNVTVNTTGGTSAAVTFTVNTPARPTLTSITPNSGAQLTTVHVTIAGTNLQYSPTVTVSGATNQVTVSNVTPAADGLSLTADFTINGNATTGGHTVTVSAGGGTAATTLTFTVTAATGAPTLTSIAPTSRTRSNASFQVVLTGTNFVTGATVNLSGTTTGVTRGAITVSADGTRITQQWTITTAAAAGARTVTVTTAAGTSGSRTFTVN
jgi:hypothetical protein